MPVFVHLTAERNLRSIRRSGIVPAKVRFGPRGVYALPVTRNFYVSHQWLRELRRWGGGTILGVYFRLPAAEPVEVGHFNRGRIPMSAAEAAGLLFQAEERDPRRARAEDEHSKRIRKGQALPSSAEGYEVFIPRAILLAEILRVKALPQVVGWRYRPGSNGQPPCACICCERGQYGVRKLLHKVEEAEALNRPTKIILFGREADSDRRVERLRRLRGKRA